MRIRITTSGEQTKKIPIFDSSEALYLWCHSQDDEYRGATIVELRNSDFIDAEWMGCEFVHEGDERSRCLNIIRAAFAKSSENDSGYVVTPIIGWTTNDLLPFRSSSFGLSIRKLNDDEGITLTNEVEF